MEDKCPNCHGEKWVQDPVWRWWKFWMNQYMLCPECYGLDPTPKQVDPSIHAFNEMFEYFDDLFMGSRAEASQYTEAIGLERLPLNECFIADTASSRCETAAQYKIRSIKEDIAEILKDPEPLSHIVRKIAEKQGKRVWESMPADKSAVFTAVELKADKQAMIDAAKEVVKPVSDECGLSDEELEALLLEYARLGSVYISPTEASENMGASMDKVKERVRKQLEHQTGEVMKLPNMDEAAMNMHRFIKEATITAKDLLTSRKPEK